MALAGRLLHSKRAVRKARNKLCDACVTPRAYYLWPCGTGRNYRPAARDDLRGIKSWLAERARVPYSIVPLTHFDRAPVATGNREKGMHSFCAALRPFNLDSLGSVGAIP